MNPQVDKRIASHLQIKAAMKLDIFTRFDLKLLFALEIPCAV